MRVYQVEELNGNVVSPSVVCLGVFDGVHLGHQQLIEKALVIAKSENLQAIVHTYDPLPVSVISPKKLIIELTPLEERVKLLDELGIQQIAVSTFNQTLMQMSGEDFFLKVLLEKLHARHIVAGFNHRFGFHADTDVNKLHSLCKNAGIGLSVIEPVKTAQGNLVSSSAIRAAILLEDYDLASLMLGRKLDQALISRLQLKNDTDAKRHNNGGLSE